MRVNIAKDGMDRYYIYPLDASGTPVDEDQATIDRWQSAIDEWTQVQSEMKEAYKLSGEGQ